MGDCQEGVCLKNPKLEAPFQVKSGFVKKLLIMWVWGQVADSWSPKLRYCNNEQLKLYFHHRHKGKIYKDVVSVNPKV